MQRCQSIDLTSYLLKSRGEEPKPYPIFVAYALWRCSSSYQSRSNFHSYSAAVEFPCLLQLVLQLLRALLQFSTALFGGGKFQWFERKRGEVDGDYTSLQGGFLQSSATDFGGGKFQKLGEKRNSKEEKRRRQR